jgi:hypothetical protein
MFGLNKNDLNNIQKKIDNQSNYLDTNYFITDSGQVKTLKDVSFSANHSERYYAQLSNKIDTMTNTAISQGLHSCFLTMTLDGYFRDLLKGDYTRFNDLSDEYMKIALQSVPNSEALGEVRQKIEARLTLTIKDLYNILNHQTKRYLQSYAFKKLKKAKLEYMYIRTAEPHKDGVPHFHMMLYIPYSYIEQFKKDFIKSYPAPRNRAKIVGSQELQSFQIDIKDTTAYVMKYILKSFMDVKKQKDIDYIQAWYIKHRIMRCVTSRALIPQWIYQKAYAFESDWFHLTDLIKNPDNQCEWSHEDNYFYLYDGYTGREIVYQYGQLEIVYEGRVIKKMGKPKEKNIKVKVYDKTPTKWEKKEKIVPVFENNNIVGHFTKQGYKQLIKQPYQMNHLELYNYYLSIDIETIDLKRYMYTKNLMIDRGLLNEAKQPINAHELLNDSIEAEGLF